MAGELDIATAALLDQALNEVEATGRQVTLDLHTLAFTDFSGVNLLVCHAARARNERFTLSIIAPSPRIARVLDLAGVTGLLPLLEPVPAA